MTKPTFLHALKAISYEQFTLFNPWYIGKGVNKWSKKDETVRTSHRRWSPTLDASALSIPNCNDCLVDRYCVLPLEIQFIEDRGPAEDENALGALDKSCNTCDAASYSSMRTSSGH